MKASCAKDLVRVRILLDDDKSFLIGASVKDKKRVEMPLFLMQNVDVFAWSPYKMPRVDLEFIVHKLNVDPLYPPKKQKPRRSAKEYVEAIRQEVKRLKETGAIKEIFFLEWLANIMVIKNKNGK